MSDIVQELRDAAKIPQSVPENLSMGAYVELVKERPCLASLAHKRIYDMIKSYGVEVDKETGEKRYLFFERELFGIERATKEFMEYFEGAAMGSDVGKRFLLLFGPPSSGKSNIVSMLKDYMEGWTKTDEGAVYGIEGCPMREDPLHAVPRELRPKLSKELGVKIEGDLCPVCSLRLRTELKNDFMGFKAKRMYFDQQGRMGIGTFVPGDVKSQDISELLGSVDVSKIGEFGTESDPRAYRFDGELNISNRGLMEFIEILKCISSSSYVLTSNGLLRIDELIRPGDKDPVGVSMSVMGRHGKPEKARYIIPKGRSKTKKIKTVRGYSLEGSIDHRVCVLSNGSIAWTEMKDIKRGDYICISRSSLWPTDLPSLSSYATSMKSSNHVRNFRSVPEKLTAEMARLIGYFVSKGWFLPNDAGIGIAATTEEIINDLKLISSRIGSPVHYAESRQWRFGSENLARLFRSFGFDGQRAKDKLVPRIIRSSPKGMVAEFLKAYFSGDGTVGQGYGISCTTASERLSEELQLLLLNFGIISSRGKVFNKEYQRYYHTVQINNSASAQVFADEIGFILERKQAAVEKFASRECKSHRDGIPTMNKHWRAMLEEFVQVPEGLSEVIKSGFFFDKVCSTGQGKSDLWDLNVPVGSSYVANGIVNHNCDQKFLYVLLTATQEKTIKTPRFPLIYCDLAIVSHTNESEYREFVGNPKNEALMDRMIVCKMPYTLEVNQEVKIYEKLLSQGGAEGIHIAPHTLRVAAIFAVLSRLEESKDKTVDKVKKMRLYNREDVEGLSPKDAIRLRKESNSEGMDGISPRYIVNRLVTTAVRGNEEKGRQRYITPVDVLRALRDGVQTSSKFKPEERAKYDETFALTKREYDEIAQNEVQKAFFVSFEDEAKALLENYLDNVEAYLEKTKITDKITGEEISPDEKLMRAVETQIGIHESSKDSFRNEVMRKAAAALRRGETFRYDQHANLRKAIEKQLFEEKRDVIKMTITTRSKQDAEQLKRINVVIKTLCDKHGYVAESANELLEYVSSIMNREKGS